MKGDGETGATATVVGKAVAQLTWMIGGRQGEGIDSTGEIVARAFHRLGYFVYGYRHFASRIKGGHTNYKLRLGAREMRCGDDGLDLLLALDQESIDHNAHTLSPGATVVHDASRFEARLPEGRGLRSVGLPLTDLAKECGGAIMRNMVAAGATAALLGLRPDDFAGVLGDRFGAKGPEVVRRNRAAVERGFARARDAAGQVLRLPPPEPDAAHPRLFLSGNEAVALGALAAGCRFLAAYPITPATEIMYWLIEHLPQVGGVVVQAEDEIAAVHMAIGANYAGVRAMTSTSGPGLSLMTEALGLAGMTETPLVVVDVQRAGPATGLPTKMEQGDLNQLVFAGHGDFPRIVLAPRTVEDCFAFTVAAFNLAERFQCPVLIASDLALGMSRQTIRGLDRRLVAVDRGALDRGAPPGWAGTPGRGGAAGSDGPSAGMPPFLRYRRVAGGVSPRARPGTPGRRHLVTGDEHDEAGRITEDPGERARQMDKRLGKVEGLDLGEMAVHEAGPPDPDLLLVGWGSTFGVLEEVWGRLGEAGYRVAHLQIGQVWPFPSRRVRARLAGARRVLVVEHSAGGQLSGLLRREAGPLPPTFDLRKYDGNPLTLGEVDRRCREVLEAW